MTIRIVFVAFMPPVMPVAGLPEGVPCAPFEVRTADSAGIATAISATALTTPSPRTFVRINSYLRVLPTRHRIQRHDPLDRSRIGTRCLARAVFLKQHLLNLFKTLYICRSAKHVCGVNRSGGSRSVFATRQMR